MKKYRKKPVIVEAEVWEKMGDVPEAGIKPRKPPTEEWGEKVCVCGAKHKNHGLCPTLEGFHIVCPGDIIIRGVKGEFYPCKPDIFEATYEELDEIPEPPPYDEVQEHL